MKNRAPSSRASVEERAIRGSRLTFLLAATGATAKLEVAAGGVRRAIMNYRLRLLRAAMQHASCSKYSTCNCTAAKAKGGSVAGISCAAHHNLNSDGWCPVQNTDGDRIDLDGG
jgi:hypothetical protein